ncbi:MAG: hypothetical protein ACD_15C00072G0001 [uncultured bacterium]|nr:MAG: hypothetical protein ACD_15C00072G0001 [uncultured bacterium]
MIDAEEAPRCWMLERMQKLARQERSVVSSKSHKVALSTDRMSLNEPLLKNMKGRKTMAAITEFRNMNIVGGIFIKTFWSIV